MVKRQALDILENVKGKIMITLKVGKIKGKQSALHRLVK